MRCLVETHYSIHSFSGVCIILFLSGYLNKFRGLRCVSRAHILRNCSRALVSCRKGLYQGRGRDRQRQSAGFTSCGLPVELQRSNGSLSTDPRAAPDIPDVRTLPR